MIVPRFPIKAAIFDVDGTLLDSTDAWTGVGIKYLINKGIPAETIQSDLDEVLDQMSLEEGAVYMQEHYGITDSVEEIRAGFLAVIDHFYREEAQLKPGMQQLLQNLADSDVTMMLCTTSGEELVLAALERCGVKDYFDGIITTEGTTTSKHEPYMYLACAEAMEAKPRETLVFEDVLFALQTAKAAGFRTVGVEDDKSASDKEAIKAISNYYLEKDFYKNYEA